MDKSEILDIYQDRCWEVTDAYARDMLVAWNGSLADLIRSCLDIFDIPAALVIHRFFQIFLNKNIILL